MVGVAQLVERAVVVRVVVGSSPTVHPMIADEFLFLFDMDINDFLAL